MKDSCNSKLIVDTISNDSKLNSIVDMLNEINKAGYPDSRIERALDFKSGQLQLWRNGTLKLEPVDYALFRILYKFPYFIKVAECGYTLIKYSKKTA